MVKILTDKEKRVLEYQNAGKNTREIADILSVSPHTVKALLTSAKRKIQHI